MSCNPQSSRIYTPVDILKSFFVGRNQSKSTLYIRIAKWFYSQASYSSHELTTHRKHSINTQTQPAVKTVNTDISTKERLSQTGKFMPH